MKEMQLTIGMFGPKAKVAITNKQNTVEYKVLSGHATESDARSAAGNIYKELYDFSYSGDYSNRKPAVDRISSRITELEKELEQLKFCLKVTKKKNWVEVK